MKNAINCLKWRIDVRNKGRVRGKESEEEKN